MSQHNEDGGGDVDGQYGPYQGPSKCHDHFEAGLTIGQIGGADPGVVDEILGQSLWATVGQIARDKLDEICVETSDLQHANLCVKWVCM